MIPVSNFEQVQWPKPGAKQTTFVCQESAVEQPTYNFNDSADLLGNWEGGDYTELIVKPNRADLSQAISSTYASTSTSAAGQGHGSNAAPQGSSSASSSSY